MKQKALRLSTKPRTRVCPVVGARRSGRPDTTYQSFAIEVSGGARQTGTGGTRSLTHTTPSLMETRTCATHSLVVAQPHPRCPLRCCDQHLSFPFTLRSFVLPLLLFCRPSTSFNFFLLLNRQPASLRRSFQRTRSSDRHIPLKSMVL